MSKWSDLADAYQDMEPRAESTVSAVCPQRSGLSAQTALSAQGPGTHKGDGDTTRDGLARLQAMPPPRPFTAETWATFLNDVETFAAKHGSTARRLAWSRSELFGWHPSARLVRVDCLGLLVVLKGRRVIDLQTDHALIERKGDTPLRWRRAVNGKAAPIWETRHDEGET